MTKTKQKVVAPEAAPLRHRFYGENPEHGTRVCVDCGIEKKLSEMTAFELALPPVMGEWLLEETPVPPFAHTAFMESVMRDTPAPPPAPPGTRAQRDAQAAANG